MSALTNVGVNYIKFINNAGKAPDSALETVVPNLCSEKCTRKVNNEVVFTTSDAFAEQLRKAHETFGKWQINQNYSLLPLEIDYSITIKYVIKTEKCGDLSVLAILKVDSNDRVIEIDEFYTKMRQK